MRPAVRQPICKKHADILRALCHLNTNQRASVLEKADSKLVKCIVECALNILKGNVPVNQAQKSKLKKHAPILRNLVSKGSLKSKKKIIVQQGGSFLPALLLPIVTTVLTELASYGAR